MISDEQLENSYSFLEAFTKSRKLTFLTNINTPIDDLQESFSDEILLTLPRNQFKTIKQSFFILLSNWN